MLASFVCNKCGSKVPEDNKIMHDINCEKIAENNLRLKQSFQCPKCQAYVENSEKEDHEVMHWLEENPYDRSSSFQRGSSFKRNSSRDSEFERALVQSIETLTMPEHPVPQDILAGLPQFEMKNVYKLPVDRKECVICMSEFEEGEKAMSLPCLHIFHYECIQNWFGVNNTCPICKYNISDPVENANI